MRVIERQRRSITIKNEKLRIKNCLRSKICSDMRKNDSMKKLIFLLMLSLCAGAVQAQVKLRNQIDRRRARNGRPAGKTGFHRPLCRLVSPVPDDGEAGLFAQGRRGVHGPAVRGGQIDTDKTTGRELMKRYGRDAIPLYLVFDTEGELLGHITGAADAETFMDNLRTIVARQKPPKKRS